MFNNTVRTSGGTRTSQNRQIIIKAFSASIFVRRLQTTITLQSDGRGHSVISDVTADNSVSTEPFLFVARRVVYQLASSCQMVRLSLEPVTTLTNS